MLTSRFSLLSLAASASREDSDNEECEEEEDEEEQESEFSSLGYISSMGTWPIMAFDKVLRASFEGSE